MNNTESLENNCENNTELINKSYERQMSENVEEIASSLTENESNVENYEVSDEDNHEEKSNLRDRSKLKKPARFENYVLLAKHPEPETYQEAMSSENSHEWLCAMSEEMESLLKNETLELVDLSPEKKAIGSLWAFKINMKADGSIQCFKAPLFAKGFNQKFSVDFSETFNPVVQ